jgi:Zn-dependent protease
MQEIIFILILIFSIVLHEIAHGFAALHNGDETAKYAGRLSLNPLKHLDLMGSVILPIVCIILPGTFLFGWAKPVPINPRNFFNERKGIIEVALAGVLTNLAIALVFGLLIRFAPTLSIADPFIILVFSAVVYINILLALFNLLPIPPLDGSKILLELLPHHLKEKFQSLQQYSFILIIMFIFFFWNIIQVPLLILFKLFSGISPHSLFSFF